MFIRRNAILMLTAVLVAGSAQGAMQTPGQVYTSECSSCHVAYPAVFLPDASWKKLLAGLSDHFGDSADLLAEERDVIARYLFAHSYDKSRIKRRYGDRFDTPGVPLRVTETRYFQAIHREIPRRLVRDNPKVKSYARCQVCHRGAERGRYDEDEVRIPR